MRWFILLPILLFAASCGGKSNATEQEASCELEARNFSAIHSGAATDVETSVELCMTAHGFSFKSEYCPSEDQVTKQTPAEYTWPLYQAQKINPKCYKAPFSW